MANAKPHLLLIGGDGGPSGVPRHIEQICRCLADADAPYRVTVVSEPDTGGYSFTSGLPVQHIAVPDLRSTANPLRIAKGFRALNAIIKADPPDVIWAHARLAVLMTRVMRHTAARLIVTFHGSPFLGHSRKATRVMGAVERIIARLGARHDTVFLSQMDRESFNDIPLISNTVHVIPNIAPDLNIGTMTPAQYPTLLMTTRNSPQKNLTGAADIFAQLPDTTRLVLLGMGTDAAPIKAAFAARLPQAALARVTFGGPVDDITPHLRSAHGYLMTSRYEGMSLGALEAFSAGLPVFMPDVGGAHEILTAHPMGSVIDPNDPRTAAQRIMNILLTYGADPSVHSKSIAAAYAATFSKGAWSAQILSLLRNG